MLKNLILITLLLGVTLSTESITIASAGDCAGTLTVSDTIGADSWAWKYQVTGGTTPVTASSTTATFDIATEITNGGTYTVTCDITKNSAVAESPTYTITNAFNCSGDPTISGTVTGCSGTLTAAAPSGFTPVSQVWKYQSTASGSTAQTGPTTLTFDVSTIAANGTYDIWVEMTDSTPKIIKGYKKATVLSACPSASIAATTAVSGCTGVYTVTPANFTPATSSGYVWKYTSSVAGSTAQTSTASTAATFDVSQIKVDGTYTLDVTLTDANSKTVSATQANVQLQGCATTTGGNTDNTNNTDTTASSANILSVLAIFLLALVL